MEELKNAARRNRILVHTPWGLPIDERRRFNQHLPVGFLAMLPAFMWPWAGITLTGLCVAYEYLNGYEKKDKSYKDLLGIAWGAGFAVYAGVVKELWLLIFGVRS